MFERLIEFCDLFLDFGVPGFDLVVGWCSTSAVVSGTKCA